MKKILITGKNSYIGTSLEKWLAKEPESYQVDTVDTRDGIWEEKDFSSYDVIFHVAAVVHQKERPEMREFYYAINRDLPLKIAKKAKVEGVSQFIFMSTMAVYGEIGKLSEKVIINRKTPVNPQNLYGISKIEAEKELHKINDDSFKIAILRPPMVYGSKCPGNYAKLEKLAIKSPIFPLIDNKRSMLHIDKLCIHVKEYIDENAQGLFFPQDDEYVNTSQLVKELANSKGKKIYLSRLAGMLIKLFGKRINLANKIFGNLIYERD